MEYKINNIYKIDCLKLMKDLPDECVDGIVTDPPYLINYKTGHRKDKTHKFCHVIENDNNEDFIKEYIKECYRIMKNNTAMYMFCSQKKVDIFKQEIEKYFNIKNIIVWVKMGGNNLGDLTHAFSSKYEFIIYCNKGNKKINGKRISDVWEFDKVLGDSQLHQNEKPIELIKQCIEKSTNENDLIFDGCMGSGTTAVACKELKRNYLGCEIDDYYFNIAIERLNNTVFLESAYKKSKINSLFNIE